MTWFIASLMIVGLWLILRPKTAPKAKTNPVQSTPRQQPKTKSQAQIKAERLKEIREAYDRDWAERRKAKGASSNYPTIEDIQKKYPKRKSQEQIKQEASELQVQKRIAAIEQSEMGESLAKERELLALIRDIKTCERLLQGLRKQYPSKTRLWIIEKAISDVERDRR